VISLSATVGAALVGIPLGLWMGLGNFPVKRVLKLAFSTAMSTPPVVLGLLLFLLLSRNGPFGSMGLLFTPMAMFIAQFLLVMPIVILGAMESASSKGKSVYELLLSLGLKPIERLFYLLKELRTALALAVLMAFGRAISEVGAVMLVGGNIKGHTRVMTTYIATYNSMGDFSASIVMAVVLMTLAFGVNLLVQFLSGGLHEHSD